MLPLRVRKRWLLVAVMVLAAFWLAAVTPITSPAPDQSTQLSTLSDTDRYGGMGGQYAPDPGEETPELPAGCKTFAASPTHTMRTLWPGMETYLNTQYVNNGKRILCMDELVKVQASSCGVVMTKIIETMRWPADLFPDPYRSYQFCIPKLDAELTQRLKSPANGTNTNPNTGSTQGGECWGWDILGNKDNICNVTKQIIKNLIVWPLRQAYQATDAQVGRFIFSTPADATYKNPTLLSLWEQSFGLACILLVVFVAWVAMRSIMGHSMSFLKYADIVEYIPRIAFGIAAAAASLFFIHTIIDLSNALSAMFPKATLLTYVNMDAGRLMAAILQSLYIILLFALILEEVARYAVLYVLIAFGPVIAMMSAARESTHLAKSYGKAVIWFSLLQPIQNALLYLSGSVQGAIGGGQDAGIMTFLVAIALMLITLAVFFIVARSALGGLAGSLGGMAAAFGGGFTGGLAAGFNGTRATLGTLGGLPGSIGRGIRNAYHTGGAVWNLGGYGGSAAMKLAGNVINSSVMGLGNLPTAISNIGKKPGDKKPLPFQRTAPTLKSVAGEEKRRTTQQARLHSGAHHLRQLIGISPMPTQPRPGRVPSAQGRLF